MAHDDTGFLRGGEHPGEHVCVPEPPDAEHCALFTAYSYPDARPGEVPPQLTGLETQPDQVSAAFPSLSVSPI